MLLWTTMPKSLYVSTVLRHGYYVCDTSKCGMLELDSATKQFQKAYDWMSAQMQEYIGPPPPNVKYPVWAWHKLRGLRKRPDLRWVEFRGFLEPMVLLECDIPDAQVLLSDEEMWTYGPLNDIPCFAVDDVASDAERSWYYDDHSISDNRKESWKLKTWQKIFHVAVAQHVQATFWILRAKDIKRVWVFNEWRKPKE